MFIQWRFFIKNSPEAKESLDLFSPWTQQNTYHTRGIPQMFFFFSIEIQLKCLSWKMSYRHVTIFSPPKDKIVLLVTVNKYNPPHRKWNMKQRTTTKQNGAWNYGNKLPLAGDWICSPASAVGPHRPRPQWLLILSDHCPLTSIIT